MATTSDLVAWAAGFFEGEGSITECGGRLRAQVKNTDFEVLTGLPRLSASGSSTGFRRNPSGCDCV